MGDTTTPEAVAKLRVVTKCPQCGNQSFNDELCTTCADEPSVEFESEHKPAWDAAALYGVLGDLTEAVLPDTEAHPAGVYADLLCRTGCSFNSGVFVGPWPRIPPRPFFNLVGPSGYGRKGTAHKVGAAIFDGGIRQINGWSSGEGFIEIMRDARDDKDLGWAKDKRHLFIEEECEKAQSVMSRAGATTGDIIKQLYDYSMVVENPKIAHTKVTMPHAVFMYDATPRAWVRWPESEITNGFLNRFLCVYVEATKELPRGGNWLNDDVLKIKQTIPVTLERARQLGELTLTSAAGEVFDVFYHELRQRQLERGDHPLNELLARASDCVTRIAQISGAMMGSKQIPSEAVQAAICLWRYGLDTVEWLWAQRESVTAKTAVHWQQTKAGADRVGIILAGLAQAQREGMTVTDIYERLQKNVPYGQIRQYLQVLKSQELAVDCERKPLKGKAVTRWFLKGHE